MMGVEIEAAETDLDQSFVAQYFARMAAGEAASVLAFEKLERELHAINAPDSLLARVRLAAQEEICHARGATALAAEFNARPRAVTDNTSDANRPPFELAVENAVFGCIEETFGALVATWQAAHAEHPAARMLMEQVAIDETSHAELAWDIAAFLHTLLTKHERAEVQAAALAALRGLAQASYHPDRSLSTLIGVPNDVTTHALVEQFRAML